MANTQADVRAGTNMSVGRYLATRVTTLVPPMNKAPNPFKTLMLLNRQQWVFFMVNYRSTSILSCYENNPY